VENNVAALKLFTLSACPMGRSMGMVMDEVQGRYEALHIDTVYVELMAQEANDYKIKKNPTTLFLNYNGEELYRIEGFAETEVIIHHLEQLNEGVFMPSEKLGKNELTIETYTVYMLDEAGLIAVEQSYNNETSIKAPRIHAILTLLKAKQEGSRFVNPFPAGSELVSVQFTDEHGTIEVRYTQQAEVEGSSFELRQQVLEQTLRPFGIERIELIETASS